MTMPHTLRIGSIFQKKYISPWQSPVGDLCFKRLTGVDFFENTKFQIYYMSRHGPKSNATVRDYKKSKRKRINKTNSQNFTEGKAVDNEFCLLRQVIANNVFEFA